MIMEIISLKAYNYSDGQKYQSERVKMKTEENIERSVGKAGVAAALRDISVEFFNKEHNGAKALEAIEKACSLEPENSLFLYDRDCLLEIVGADPGVRLSLLEDRKELIGEREELTLNYISLLRLNNKPNEALEMILGRDYSLDKAGQIRLASEYKKTLCALAAGELSEGYSVRALAILEMSRIYPKNLGIDPAVKVPDNMGWFMTGEILKERGEDEEALEAYGNACEGEEEPKILNDISDIPFDHIYWQGLAKARLGQKKEALEMMRKLIDFGNGHNEPEADFKENSNGDYGQDIRRLNQDHSKRLTALGIRGLGEIG